jgi:hypothetical protein
MGDEGLRLSIGGELMEILCAFSCGHIFVVVSLCFGF